MTDEVGRVSARMCTRNEAQQEEAGTRMVRRLSLEKSPGGYACQLFPVSFISAVRPT
jgi:hypothetical protein